MTLLDHAVNRMARTKRSQSARLIPLAAAVGDLVTLALAVFIAMIGRQELTFFRPTADVVDVVGVVGVSVMIGVASLLVPCAPTGARRPAPAARKYQCWPSAALDRAGRASYAAGTGGRSTTGSGRRGGRDA